MRKIPAKNYVILTFVAIGVVLISLIARNIYKKNNTDVRYSSVVKEIVNEIKYEDLENYLQENPSFVLFIDDGSKKNRESQKDTKKIILDNSIQQYVVYIEKNDEVIKRYDLNSNNPIFIAYDNGVITEILSQDNYTYKEIESFFVRNKVIDNG